MVRKKSIKIIIIFFLLFIIIPSLVNAQTTPSIKCKDVLTLKGQMACNLQKFLDRVGFRTENISLPIVIANVVRFSLSVIGIVFLVLIVYSGFRWMTAAGNEEQITSALKTIKNAGIGLLLVFAAYSITYTIFLILENASKSGVPTP